MKKLALVVGINYTGTNNQLNGCLNDAKNMKELLSKLGFDVFTLFEEEAHAENIRRYLYNARNIIKDGDVFAFTYSGHGSQIPDEDGDELDFLDEVLVPWDFDWTAEHMITDDWFRDCYFNKWPDNANFTGIFDCCHSKTGLKDLHYKSNPKRIVNPVVPFSPKGVNAAVTVPDNNKKIFLLSGCQSDQTSADAYINGSYCGAFTNSLLKVWDSSLTYEKLIEKIDKNIKSAGYEQLPGLDVNDKWKNTVVLT